MTGVPRIISKHPKRAEIDLALDEGVLSQRQIADKYGVHHVAINRYNAARNPDDAKIAESLKAKELMKAKGQAGKALTEPLSFLERRKTDLERVGYLMEKMEKLYEACERFLADPNTPGQYDLMPRSWEYEVIYRENEPDTDRMVTKKATLQHLLEKIDAQGYQPWEVRMKSEDPRKLIVATANSIAKQLELLGKLEGKIQEKVEVNVSVTQTWLEVKALVLKATEDYPEVQARLLKELELHA